MKVRLMLVLLVLVLPLVSSSIFVEPLRQIYNYGDQVSVDTTIVPSVTTSSHYVVDLKCGTNFTANVFNSFFEAQANVEIPVTVTTELLSPLLENMTSSCFLRASFANEVVNSNSFMISKLIDVDAELEVESLNPGQTLYVSGSAIKRSSVPVDGFAELFIPALNLYKSALVIDGFFNITIVLPSNSKSGDHNFTVEVHNTDYNSRKINSGSYYNTFSVGQILKEVNIHLNDEIAKPESEFIFRIDTLDQAGDLIDKEVSLTVNKPKGIPFIKKIVKSGEDQKISFFLNDSPGYWSIETDVDGLLNRKLFYLSEINTLQTSLINNTLIVTNVGNAPYSGPLEITIGSFVEVKQVKLGPGETQKFTLRAPDGDYSIAVSDKAGEIKTLGSAFLTGNAVKVTDFREDVIYTFTNPLIWWLGVILLILVIILVQVRLRMQKVNPRSSISSMSSNKVEMKPAKTEFTPNTRSNIFDSSDNKSKFDMSWFNKPKVPSSATSSVNSFLPVAKVSPTNLFGTQGQGIRERAVAIALYIHANSPSVSETLNRALSLAQEVKAKVYVDGEYKIVLLSPRLTGSQDNESSAISVARRIQALFLEHSSINNDGINFGIGVSDGEIISEVENNKFHFTSTGNLISYAKRLANASNTKLLISDSIRRKVISTVKAERSPFQGVWEVLRVIDHSSSKDFIKRFSDRNK
ncbi:MAG: hypothetical protein AABX23_01445 [Nanoarchaeota archaeon]